MKRSREPKPRLVICGAGGFAREVFRWVQNHYHVVAFIADGEKENRDIFGIPVIAYPRTMHSGLFFMVAIGHPSAREQVHNRTLAAGLVPAPAFVHPSCVVGDTELGAGTIICPGSIITTNVRIGTSVIINIGCTIGHDTVIGSFSTLSPGANISGNVIVGELAYLGTGCSVREKVRVGSRSTLGMGAALVKDLPENQVWGGVPAKLLVTG